jgi:hypothetical protein
MSDQTSNQTSGQTSVDRPAAPRFTQDDASLNARQWRLADSAARHGYQWFLQEESVHDFVIAPPVEHPFSERNLLVYRSGTTQQGAAVFLADGSTLTRISTKAAFSMLVNRSL